MRRHSFLRVCFHIPPILISTIGPAIKDLHREPAPETCFEDRFRNIDNRQIAPIERHRPQTRAPPSSGPHTTFIWLRVQRLFRLVRIRNLQDVDFVSWYRLAHNRQARLKLLL